MSKQNSGKQQYKPIHILILVCNNNNNNNNRERWTFHESDRQYRLLGCDTVYTGRNLIEFWRNMLSTFLGKMRDVRSFSLMMEASGFSETLICTELHGVTFLKTADLIFMNSLDKRAHFLRIQRTLLSVWNISLPVIKDER
jgi:hypothetical protein